MTEVVLVDTDVFSYIWQGRPEAEPFAPLVEGRIAPSASRPLPRRTSAPARGGGVVVGCRSSRQAWRSTWFCLMTA